MQNPLRTFLDRIEPLFTHGGKLERLYPVYEAADTFLFTPGSTTKGKTHVRDAADLKRIMSTVAVALTPCILMAVINTGYQANLAMQTAGLTVVDNWRGLVMTFLGLSYDPGSIFSNIVHGALYFVPVFLVANIAGGLCEAVFSIVRKHEINEGFLVTGLLYPLTLPPAIPLWQVAIGIVFGVVVAKEVFGGTGKNFLNVALTARAFLYFAYPAQISGDAVWVAVDGYTHATPLGLGASEGFAAIQSQLSWTQAFFGIMPGSLGETSTFACLLGMLVLGITGVGSIKIILTCMISAFLTAWGLYAIGSDTNPMFSVPPLWHFVIGGMMFGFVFMATDPVTASMTEKGKYFYGIIIGVMVILIRVVNPAFPEGIMLAILFGNVFAPVIDNLILKRTIARRRVRLGV